MHIWLGSCIFIKSLIRILKIKHIDFINEFQFDDKYWTLIAKRLPLHKGAFFMFIYGLSIFLTSTAFVDTNAKYGTPQERYAVFLKTVPKSDALSR